jgi:HSP20 family protein
MASKSLFPYSWFDPPARGGEVNPFLTLRQDLDRMVQDFGRGLFDWPGSRLAAPKVDISETASEIRIAAELPGMTEKDVEVELHDDVLTIRGEKKDEREEKGENRHLVERSYGAFARSFQLPPGLDAANISASFDKGVLRITLPKPPEAASKARKIEVKPAAS